MIATRHFQSAATLLSLAVVFSTGVAAANDIKVYSGAACAEAIDTTIGYGFPALRASVTGGRIGNADQNLRSLVECPFVIDDSGSGALDVTVWATDRAPSANLSCRVATRSESGSSIAWTSTKYATPSQTDEVGHTSASPREMNFSIAADYVLGSAYVDCDIPPMLVAPPSPLFKVSSVNSYWVDED